ncbi:hypothetical protein BURC_00672 [Burkholderiaceae bacterium]|nr:hypothetical protein BURC_00672 [Burkholderiaceae bacterium]
MKRIIAVALMTCATLASAQSSPAKKELVAKLLVLQQPGIDNMAKSIAERPVVQLMQHAGNALQSQVPADKREATAKTLQADAQKFVEEAYPVIRDQAIKLAPTTVGPVLEEKFNEDELRQLVAWFESPVNKKYQQVGPELQSAMLKKLLAEASPVLDPKLQALQQKMGNTLRAAAGNGAGKPAASGAKPPAKAASK